MTPFVPPAAPDFLALSYRPDLHLLVSRWQRPVSDAELRAGYRATLALAQAVGCPYWQLDLRGGNAPGPATRQWLTEKFLPGQPAGGARVPGLPAFAAAAAPAGAHRHGPRHCHAG